MDNSLLAVRDINHIYIVVERSEFMSKKVRNWIIIGIVSISVLLLICDMRLKTVKYEVRSDKIEKRVRIVLVTDLHGCNYGKNQKNLIEAIEKEKPDVVLLGGDIFDDNVPYENSTITIKQLAEKYPCYYVTGNHEYWSYDIDNILEIIEECGVNYLSAECKAIEINGQSVNICGVDDPDVIYYTNDGIPIEEQLQTVSTKIDKENFNILLSHRPELAELYQQYDYDLVLNGHAHGGQWRIPGILNGLYAPHQGLFPKYAGGRYDFKNQTMIVSRGLARESTLAPRIFNRPEIVFIDIIN